MVRRILFLIARTVILVYVGLGLLLFFSQRNYVYMPNHPQPSAFIACEAFGSGAENVVFKGMRAHHKSVSDRAVVFYHGNAGSACDRAVLAPMFEDAGYSYVFVEYPGYAGDSVDPSKHRILENVAVVQEFLNERGYDEVVIVGESLGVGVAAYHAKSELPSRLILISPHYELADLAGWIGSFYPVHLLLRENYTPGEWLVDVLVPVLLIEATKDEIVPRSSADRLHASLSGETERVLIEAGHNNLYSQAEFSKSIKRFLEHAPE